MTQALKRSALARAGSSTQASPEAAQNRERVLLLKVADKHILVAATAQTISPLHVFDELPETQTDAPEPTGGFAQLVQSLNGGAER